MKTAAFIFFVIWSLILFQTGESARNEKKNIGAVADHNHQQENDEILGLTERANKFHRSIFVPLLVKCSDKHFQLLATIGNESLCSKVETLDSFFKELNEEYKKATTDKEISENIEKKALAIIHYFLQRIIEFTFLDFNYLKSAYTRAYGYFHTEEIEREVKGIDDMSKAFKETFGQLIVNLKEGENRDIKKSRQNAVKLLRIGTELISILDVEKVDEQTQKCALQLFVASLAVFSLHIIEYAKGEDYQKMMKNWTETIASEFDSHAVECAKTF